MQESLLTDIPEIALESRSKTTEVLPSFVWPSPPAVKEKPVAVFDVECYRNFFLIVFMEVNTGKVLRCQISPNWKLDKSGLQVALFNYLLVGFNSNEYDVPMIQLALKGATADQLKDISDEIIKDGGRAQDIAYKYGLVRPYWDHIDLIQVAPLKASLKIYAGRLHCKKMQDLPF